jgi:hypothetical protein
MGAAKRRRGAGGGGGGPPLDLEGEIASGMEDQRAAFVAKFGREPAPGDPVFFDPDADEPRPYPPERMTAEMVVTMIRAGTPEELVYIYLRTGGLMPMAGRDDVLSEEDRRDLRIATAEYARTFGGAPAGRGRRGGR